ncbi:hypothetical protein AAC387_Pa03g4032 [Persea americana]
MLALDEVAWEDTNEQGLPPGFRFHPTDEELITFYLASKVFNGTFCGVEIAEVDLNRCEPWELPDIAKMGEREWYFFSLRDRKYPTGLRTNRATEAGYWKATGKDREVYSASNGALLGMKKTLVFYMGRAPRGEKTKWVMHEYRLDGDFSYRHTCKDEWVICRIFHKIGGEKKNPFLQINRHFLQQSPPSTTSLPPLLESLAETFPHSCMGLQDGKLKAPNPSPIPITFQPFSYPTNPSILKSFSHQFLLKEPPIFKQCKIENPLLSFHPQHPTSNWVDGDHQPQQNHRSLDMCSGVLGLSTAGTAHDMSPSVSFGRAGFQMLDAPHIGGFGESGPLFP